jgi:DNA-binding NarL/FixJ family response regulator
VASTDRPRVLIADDHPGVLTSLRRVLAFDCDVVGTVQDGGALLESAVRLQPDVVVADLNMPTLNGLDACRQLIREHPGMKVILLSGLTDTQLAEHALAAGASAFLAKYALAPEQLIETIRRVCAR